MLILLAVLLQPAPSRPPYPNRCPDGSVIRADLACSTAKRQPSEARYVFFDSGGTEIRREWEPVIIEAAEAVRVGGRLSLSAYSDRSGSSAGNLRISAQRLDRVRAALIAAGVPEARIVAQAYGEARPLVPTADDVREVQNRRVEIIVTP